MKHILTTRFTADTLATNRATALSIQKQCIYSSPTPIDASIPANAIMFVIEMNNTTNQIAGIGMLRNRGVCNQYTIYTDARYNTFTYTGAHRIAREDLTADELAIVQVLEILCFTGAYHMKRLAGITRFAPETLRWCVRIARIDVSEEISAMFRRRARASAPSPPSQSQSHTPTLTSAPQ